MIPSTDRNAALQRGRDDARAQLRQQSTACVVCHRERATHHDGTGDLCWDARQHPEATGVALPVGYALPGIERDRR